MKRDSASQVSSFVGQTSSSILDARQSIVPENVLFFSLRQVSTDYHWRWSVVGRAVETLHSHRSSAITSRVCCPKHLPACSSRSAWLLLWQWNSTESSSVRRSILIADRHVRWSVVARQSSSRCWWPAFEVLASSTVDRRRRLLVVDIRSTPRAKQRTLIDNRNRLLRRNSSEWNRSSQRWEWLLDFETPDRAHRPNRPDCPSYRRSL